MHLKNFPTKFQESSSIKKIEETIIALTVITREEGLWAVNSKLLEEKRGTQKKEEIEYIGSGRVRWLTERRTHNEMYWILDA